MANPVIKGYVTPTVEDKKAPTNLPPIPSASTNNDDITAKRESLAILATIGNTKELIGVSMSLEDVHKLSEKDVEKYYVRYQIVLGQQLVDGLVDSGIEAALKVASYLLPVDDSEKLYNTWRNNKLLVRDLSMLAGFLALKGGRFVTLASFTFDLTKHIKLDHLGQKYNKFQDVLGTFQDTLSTAEQPLEKPLEINLEDL